MTGYIGDVPDSVGTRSILQAATGQCISKALDELLVAVGGIRIECSTVCMHTACSIFAVSSEGSIVGTGCHLHSIGIKHAWIDVFAHFLSCFLEIRSLRLVLCNDVLARDGINQPRTANADGRFQTNGIVARNRIGIECRLWNGNLRINQVELLTVRELH